MPKSAKKKKEKVADFSKAKLKLGKGKQVANNAIDTSFKARSIVLPSQSINVDKDTAEPITRRQLTFGDLLSHLKHYNAGQRKDAILGLRELFDSNWGLLDSCLPQLVNAIVRVIGDEDAGVRKQLLAFWNWLLPQIPSEDLIPHSPLLLLFTTSAQTHIFPEIRIDAIRFLDILLDCIPESVISGWCEVNDGHGSRVLGGYLGILNAGTKYGETDGPVAATSTASVVLTPASKLVVLRSLSNFLRLALAPLDGQSRGAGLITSNSALDADFMRNAFPTLEAYHSFDRLLESTFDKTRRTEVFRTWQPEVLADDELADLFTQHYPLAENLLADPWMLADLANTKDASGASDAMGTSRLATTEFVSHLATTLHSTIIETYLDCAPSVFMPGSTPSETETQLIVTAVRIAQSLYHIVLQSPENMEQALFTRLESIVNYMVPYFPASTRDAKLEQSYEEFNLIFCELTSLLVNAVGGASPRSLQRRKASRRAAGSTGERSRAPIQTRQVTQYIIRRLRGEAAASAQIGAPISATAYRALLPTVWALVSSNAAASGDAQEPNEVLHAVLDHAVKLSSKAACKRLTVEFAARLMLLGLEPHYRGDFSADKDPTVKEKFDAWFLHLPQVLWELGSSNLPSTEVILRILLRVLQRRPKVAQSEMITSLQSRLVPYFYMDHPSRGALAGPYKKLPASSGSRVRRLALDVVATVIGLGKQGSKEAQALEKAVGLAVVGEEEEAYWSHVLMSSMKQK